MVLRLIGGPDVVIFTGPVRHLDMVAKHHGDIIFLRKICKLGRASSIGGPVLHGQESCIKHVTGQYCLALRVVYRDMRDLVTGNREYRFFGTGFF
jgi:hypothetical protein